MKITNVAGEDFCSLEKVEFSLDSQGLVLLMGENQDDTSSTSNGSGKSSLADLINWTLWGNTARGSKGDAIIRRGAKQAIGEIYLEDGNDNWIIQRSRQKGKENLKLTYVPADKTSPIVDHTQGTNALTQALIQKILGCTEEVFRAAIYVGQEDLPDLPAMTDKPLKELIERAAGVDVLERALKVASEKSQKAKLDLFESSNNVTLLENNISNIKQRIDDNIINESNWRDDRQQQHLNVLDALDKLITLKKELEKKLASTADSAKLNAGVKAIMARLGALDAEAKEHARLARLVVIAEQNVSQAESDLARKERIGVGVATELSALQGRLGTPCPECGTKLTEDHLHDVESAIQARHAQAMRDHAAAQGALTEAQGALTEARAACEAYVATMQDATALHASNTKLALALRERQALEDKFQQAARDILDKGAQAHAIAAKINPHIEAGIELQTKLSEQEAKLADAKMAHSLAENQVELTKFAVQVFGPAGVRAHMLDEVTPYLNERTAEYLTTMSDGNITAVWSTLTKNKKGEYKERFAIDVSYQGEGGFSDLSGGQKRKVRIACALALQDLVASRASKPFDLWIVDEIDTALDMAGLERLMMVLQSKAKERGTVICISHSDLKSWIPNAWTMTLKGGKSTLTT